MIQMQLAMRAEHGYGLTSRPQIVRRITESWGAENLYCVACTASHLERTTANTEAEDFVCKCCSARYEMKAGRRWNESRIPDAGYDAMMRAINGDRVPNLLVLQYTPQWRVVNLMLVPSFFFSASAIERRQPLGPKTRRAGWVGCNILLKAIPIQGRIRLVDDGGIADPTDIRKSFAALHPLSNVSPRLRGWTLDVWNIVNQLGRDFSLHDVYESENDLKKLYPNNCNVRPKIRQQLQVLRDLGFLAFKRRGQYARVDT